MDYASDIDELGFPVRRKRRGGSISFMVIAIGTVCLAAAWIMTASDPYSDLAHRVGEVPVPPETAEAEPIPLFEVAASSTDRVHAAAGIEEAALPVPPVGVDDAAPEPLSPALARLVPPRLPVDVPEMRSGAVIPDLVGPVRPIGMAEEHALALTEVERRAVQRRLGMSGLDLGTPDGIFGPQTRDAVERFQRREGLPVTGYVDEPTLTALIEKTEAEYAAWAESRQETDRPPRALRSSEDTTLAVAPFPVERRPIEKDDCRRKPDGSVVGRQSLGCDLRGFGEGLRGVFTGELAPRGPAQLEGLADPDR